MRFFVQFIRFRRGVPEAIRTMPIDADDCEAALARVIAHVGTGTWPMNTEALRVMDDGGRTMLQWTVPTPAEQQTAPSSEAASGSQTEPQPLLVEQAIGGEQMAGAPLRGHAHLEVGQAISYAEDSTPETWKGGYQIVNAPDLAAGEVQYTIRSADEAHDRSVEELELREDLGSRTRGQ